MGCMCPISSERVKMRQWRNLYGEQGERRVNFAVGKSLSEIEASLLFNLANERL